MDETLYQLKDARRMLNDRLYGLDISEFKIREHADNILKVTRSDGNFRLFTIEEISKLELIFRMEIAQVPNEYIVKYFSGELTPKEAIVALDRIRTIIDSCYISREKLSESSFKNTIKE